MNDVVKETRAKVSELHVEINQFWNFFEAALERIWMKILSLIGKKGQFEQINIIREDIEVEREYGKQEQYTNGKQVDQEQYGEEQLRKFWNKRNMKYRQ